MRKNIPKKIDFINNLISYYNLGIFSILLFLIKERPNFIRRYPMSIMKP